MTYKAQPVSITGDTLYPLCGIPTLRGAMLAARRIVHGSDGRIQGVDVYEVKSAVGANGFTEELRRCLCRLAPDGKWGWV